MSEFQILISEAHIVRPAPSYHKPLGIILQESELVLPSQVEIALQDKKIHSHLKIGEILALRGWVKQETADFFAQEWDNLIVAKDKQQIGYYLCQASLLEEKNIQEILAEQKRLGIRFGSVAVLRGWIKDKTLDFFLRYLYPEQFQPKNWQTGKDTVEHLITMSGKTTQHPAMKTKDKSTSERLLTSNQVEDSKHGNLFAGTGKEEDEFIKWVG